MRMIAKQFSYPTCITCPFAEITVEGIPLRALRFGQSEARYARDSATVRRSAAPMTISLPLFVIVVVVMWNCGQSHSSLR
jgi:hypothetical protein